MNAPASSQPPCSRKRWSGGGLRVVLTFALILQGVRTTLAQEELNLEKLFREGIPKSPFIAVVYAHADALLEHGRDGIGASKTPLFLSALDRTTLSPLSDFPAAPAGLPPAWRPGKPGERLCGANLLLDQNLLRLLYFLKELTGKEHYATAADEALKWFLDNAQSPGGPFHWGRGSYWDALADAPAPGSSEIWEESSASWRLWERCLALAPASCQRLAVALARSRTGKESPRQVGFALRLWAEVYVKTRESIFLEAIDAALLNSLPSSDPAALLSLALDCDGAARRVPEPLRTRLVLHARREDARFCGLAHPLLEKKGFLQSLPGNAAVAAATPLWCSLEGELTTAGVALLCVSRYENSPGAGFERLIVSAAQAYLDSLPDEACDAWPMTFGHAMSLELAAFRITADELYFRRAFELGEIAIARFYGGKLLPRASLRTEHYESTTGANSLLLALVDLHLTTLTITAVRAPVNTLDR